MNSHGHLSSAILSFRLDDRRLGRWLTGKRRIETAYNEPRRKRRRTIKSGRKMAVGGEYSGAGLGTSDSLSPAVDLGLSCRVPSRSVLWRFLFLLLFYDVFTHVRLDDAYDLYVMIFVRLKKGGTGVGVDEKHGGGRWYASCSLV